MTLTKREMEIILDSLNYSVLERGDNWYAMKDYPSTLKEMTDRMKREYEKLTK